MNPKLYLLFTVIGITACAGTPLYRTVPMLEPSEHKLTRHFVPKIQEDGLFHLSCTDKLPSGDSFYAAFDADKAATGTRAQLASRHFVHAAMASNVYRKPFESPIFVIPDWFLLDRQESTSGLMLDVYGTQSTIATSSQIVVAYRGTDFDSILDWKTNFSITEPQQFRQAFDHLKRVRELNHTARITTVGHSLGGAIAINLSLRNPNVHAVAFNPSPRAFFGKRTNPENERTLIYEKGEVLDLLFGPWLRFRLPSSTMYGNYNFLDYRVTSISPLPEHGIYELARALTVVAMMRDSETARELFVANISEAKAREVDWDSCAWLYKPNVRP